MTTMGKKMNRHAAVLLLSGMLYTTTVKSNLHTPGPGDPPVKAEVACWLTTPDKTALFTKQAAKLAFKKETKNDHPVIDINEAQTFQEIDGFGYALTGGSATLIHSLPEATQDALLKELFLTAGTHIGISYLRVSIGASDLSDTTFTYDEMPAGQTDEQLQHFSIAPEYKDLIPVLKKIVALNPAIKILGSPWTAPTWMKTNNSFKGGSLKTEYYTAYAQYLVKYIQAMRQEGIVIDAITPQNEPLHGGNVPSMVMQPAEQAAFIGSHLGPAFRSAGIKTKIIIYDHNADRPDYPITVLNDAGARPYVDGSAFHLYGGPITALSEVHNAYPDKHVYFTEQWVGGPGKFPSDLQWHVSTLVIGATRNWSRNVLEWNLAADPAYKPHTIDGCTTCLGALTIDGNTFVRNVAYYIIAHASKFVRPGAVRIASTVPAELNNVAFKTRDGKKVLIVVNNGKAPQTFNIRYNGKVLTSSLGNGAVATYVW
ncbi:MAG TPA: glycoside hydrolase family 30 beta sandwich domain-containing protein [Chitinophaga sp.]